MGMTQQGQGPDPRSFATRCRSAVIRAIQPTTPTAMGVLFIASVIHMTVAVAFGRRIEAIPAVIGAFVFGLACLASWWLDRQAEDPS